MFESLEIYYSYRFGIFNRSYAMESVWSDGKEPLKRRFPELETYVDLKCTLWVAFSALSITRPNYPIR